MKQNESKRGKTNKNEKTITLRLSGDTYEQLVSLALQENRTISNFIETLALQQLQQQSFVDDFEMQEIFLNKDLLKRLKAGSNQAKKRKGKFV